MFKNQKGFHHIVLLLLVLVVGVIGLIGYKVFQNNPQLNPSAILKSNGSNDQKALAAGKMLTANKCSGAANLTFTHLPMNAADFNLLIPYGLVVGDHVTPIDHQYFQPTVFQSPRDTYPVFAMADAHVVDIQPRYTPNHGTDYRLIFAHSCTSIYYYDLVTSLTGPVKAAYDKDPNNINLAVTSGEQIGAIGGQTLDFALWDTHTHLSGFVNPDSYNGEAWKIYTTDPFPYYTPQLRAIVEAKDPRVAQPIAGKIDYDIDGKLIGNWFQQGTGGYHDLKLNPASDYSKTHLSIAPSLYDPSHFIISLGDFGGQATQFAAQGNTPDPASVSQQTGLVKYSLTRFSYTKADGSPWDQMGYTPAPKLVEGGQMEGCLLVQLTDNRTLKAESFVKQNCSAVAGFDSSAKIYTR